MTFLDSIFFLLLMYISLRVFGYTKMKAGWKELAENVRAQNPEERLGYILEVAHYPSKPSSMGHLSLKTNRYTKPLLRNGLFYAFNCPFSSEKVYTIKGYNSYGK